MPSNPQLNMQKESKKPEYWREDISTYNLMNSPAFAQGERKLNQLAQGFAYDPSGEATINQRAQMQAQQNVRGIGNTFANVGAAGSGAAAAAAAQGAATPYYEAQMGILEQKRRAQEQAAGFRGQAMGQLMNQFLGVQKSASGAEKDVTRQKMGSQ